MEQMLLTCFAVPRLMWRKFWKGAKPGDLPIEQPMKFDSSSISRPPRHLGLQIPYKMLAIADEVDRMRRQFRVAVLDKGGNAVIEKIPPPRLLSELPEDLQRMIKSVTTDAADRLIPMMYSKMTANQELRKLCRVGAAGAGADKVRNSCSTSRPPKRLASICTDAACAWLTR